MHRTMITEKFSKQGVESCLFAHGLPLIKEIISKNITVMQNLMSGLVKGFF